MDPLILLISAGFGTIGLLLWAVPGVGRFVPDPRPFSPEEKIRRTRLIGILMFGFSVAMIVLFVVKLLLWP